MKIPRQTAAWGWRGVCCLLFFCSLVLNQRELHDLFEHSIVASHALRERGYCGNGAHTDSFRELVERFVPADASVYYCADSEDGRLQPAERSIHLALSWAASPRAVRFGGTNGVRDASFVVASRFRRASFPGYRRVAQNECAALWQKEDNPVHSTARSDCPPPSPLREGLGVAVASLLVVGLVFLVLRSCGGSAENRLPPIAVASVAVAVFLVAGYLALSHTFIAPTGLGVYGGKARLLFLGGGLPSGFFTDAAYSSFQPAYPPGLALLTLVAYAVAGGCGEWLTQLLVVVAFAAVVAILCSRARSFSGCVFVLALMLTPLALRVASLYYAEPFVALCVLVGWLRVRGRRGDCVGWFVLGLAGLFKNEGMVLALVCWLALRLVEGRREASVRGLVVALALPALWQVGCRLSGATLYDFAAPWNPDLSWAWTALVFALKEVFACPWQSAVVWPLALALGLALLARRMMRRHVPFATSGFLAALLVAALSFGAFVFVFSISRAPDFAWHLRTAMPRLLWTPALLLALEILRLDASRES